jgi:arginyl-tRNA synthetase
MHVGHARGAVFGDALATLLAFAGWEVTREYYVNDGGAQVDVLARSAFERYREAHGLSPEIAEGLYPGDYLIPWARPSRSASAIPSSTRPRPSGFPRCARSRPTP